MCSINVHLGLLKADVEFLWWWVAGGVCKVIFVSNHPIAVLRLSCRGGCDNIKLQGKPRELIETSFSVLGILDTSRAMTGTDMRIVGSSGRSISSIHLILIHLLLFASIIIKKMLQSGVGSMQGICPCPAPYVLCQ